MAVRRNRDERGSEAYIDNVGGTYPGVYSRRVGDRTRYGAEVAGLPFSGSGQRTLNTPIGEFRGGLSDDGVAGLSYTPPAFSRENWSTPYVDYSGAYIDNVAGMYPEVYRHRVGDETNYGAAIEGMPFAGNGWGELNTPIGRLRGGLSDDRVLGAEFTPNPYYIQALANLLSR